MHLVLVRHGETEENVRLISQGHTDGKLTDLGYTQIKNVAERLSGRKFDAAYTSDLKRCTETARIISEKNPNIIFTETISARERNNGEFQGMYYKDIPWDSIEGTWFTRRPPGGESIQDLYNRAQNLLHDLREKHDGETVLLVTHGGFIRVIYAIIENKTGEELSDVVKYSIVENTSISEIKFSPDKNEILCWNSLE
jgi:broad specificity phosphatase PhoE